ncbi:hypothetical protein QR680_002904 [Steinernema hermaphroditum]|uniref:Serine/threonine specific protein phosphatases domain-containing protein n=1 Tax=Steinernema hermaphroditum TaxID=289476 RepID=A0AA39H6Q4_9BILA|nr:hypothetical protein QR680_002904 [Steinernema hermaphroditum]
MWMRTFAFSIWTCIVSWRCSTRRATNEPNLAKLLFLGDYSDRGPDLLDRITSLCALRMIRQGCYNMLRTNHKTQAINHVYGFFDEINRKIGNADEALEMWRAFNDLFAVLPLAAVVLKRILCMHCGISPKLQSLDEIRAIKRPLDDPELACDLLWADAMTDFEGFKHNHVRGVGVYFGEESILQVLEKLKLQLIVECVRIFSPWASSLLHSLLQMIMYGCGFFCKQVSFIFC